MVPEGKGGQQSKEKRKIIEVEREKYKKRKCGYKSDGRERGWVAKEHRK